ncbi:hypothetical protein BGC07_15765 [Piscirickettsia litoralis]|uniref:Peptidase S49 domain-containing protein n=2 Tax=Piscirickettsia litoralis TaxID=1891921 RepID=A0ABX3A626_9GAMM|nr:hypothetical protein BGC07_15765 [Piscirickettsia litoralis]
MDFSKYINSPLYVCERDIGMMSSAIQGKVKLFFNDDEVVPRLSIKSGVAVIPVRGSLVQRDRDAFYYGMTSYESIGKMINAALKHEDVDTLLLDIDSGGGMVSGLFDLLDTIVAAREQKKVIAISNESAYSAAYAIGSAAEKLYMTSTAGVGSIGVLMVHTEFSELYKSAGITTNVLRVGDEKAKPNALEKLEDKTRTELLDSMKKSYDLFVDSVVSHRDIDRQAVIDTQARCYDSDEAIKLGLADAVISYSALLSQLTASDLTENTMSTDTPTETAEIPEAQHAQVAETPEAKPVQEAPSTAMISAESIKEIKGMCETAGCPERALGFVAQGFNVKQVKLVLGELMVAETSANIDHSIKGEEANDKQVLDVMVDAMNKGRK